MWLLAPTWSPPCRGLTLYPASLFGVILCYPYSKKFDNCKRTNPLSSKHLKIKYYEHHQQQLTSRS